MAADLPDYTSAVSSPSVHLQQIVVPAGVNNQEFGPISPPAGTVALAFTVEGSALAPTGVGTGMLTSDTTHTAVMSDPGVTTLDGGAVVFPLVFDPQFESSYHIVLSNTDTVAHTVDVWALFDVLALAAAQPVNVSAWESGLTVRLLDANALAIVQGQRLMARSLPVAVASDQPAGRAGQQLMAASLPVVVASDQPALQVRAYRRPFDGLASNHGVAIGVKGTCTLAAQAGKIWTVGHISGGAVQGGAAAAVGRLQLLDGAAVIWEKIWGLPATNGSTWELDLADLAIAGTAGNAVTLSFDALAANIYQSVNLAAWLN